MRNPYFWIIDYFIFLVYNKIFRKVFVVFNPYPRNFAWWFHIYVEDVHLLFMEIGKTLERENWHKYCNQVVWDFDLFIKLIYRYGLRLKFLFNRKRQPILRSPHWNHGQLLALLEYTDTEVLMMFCIMVEKIN